MSVTNEQNNRENSKTKDQGHRLFSCSRIKRDGRSPATAIATSSRPGAGYVPAIGHEVIFERPVGKFMQFSTPYLISNACDVVVRLSRVSRPHPAELGHRFRLRFIRLVDGPGYVLFLAVVVHRRCRCTALGWGWCLGCGERRVYKW